MLGGASQSGPSTAKVPGTNLSCDVRTTHSSTTGATACTSSYVRAWQRAPCQAPSPPDVPFASDFVAFLFLNRLVLDLVNTSMDSNYFVSVDNPFLAASPVVVKLQVAVPKRVAQQPQLRTTCRYQVPATSGQTHCVLARHSGIVAAMQVPTVSAAQYSQSQSPPVAVVAAVHQI